MDPAKWCRSEQIRIHNTGWHYGTLFCEVLTTNTLISGSYLSIVSLFTWKRSRGSCWTSCPPPPAPLCRVWRVLPRLAAPLFCFGCCRDIHLLLDTKTVTDGKKMQYLTWVEMRNFAKLHNDLGQFVEILNSAEKFRSKFRSSYPNLCANAKPNYSHKHHKMCKYNISVKSKEVFKSNFELSKFTNLVDYFRLFAIPLAKNFLFASYFSEICEAISKPDF